ncbi:MAG: nucleotide exchange factor GrpE [Pirellulaceae bacterium]|nr:nucleotide exchange factor GrpE [Pirellulaceae bacterium]
MNDEELLGAVDIVAAFTALRHELKTQIRSGRDLQQSLVDQLAALDGRWQMALKQVAASTANSTGPGNQAASSQAGGNQSGGSGHESVARKLAEALSEIEESLDRAINAMPGPASPSPHGQGPASNSLLSSFDQTMSQVPWLIRGWVTAIFGRFRQQLIESQEQTNRLIDQQSLQLRSKLNSTHQGLTLLLTRVHRLMQQGQVERVDVLGKPFDAEIMHAIDLIDSLDHPSSHVAEQLRPAYMWNGKLLRCAEVRISR